MSILRVVLIVSCVTCLLSLAWFSAGRPLRAQEAQPDQAKVLRHVVCFKFKETSSREDIARIEIAFRALPGKIDVIKDFEWGTDVSVEGKADGFTHCFLVTFASEQDRATYLPHPAHQAFVNLVGPHVDKVFVIDYWSST